MHVIRNKHSKQVLHIDYAVSEGPLPGGAVFADFEPDSMELGWTAGKHIPSYFDIDERQHVVELPLHEAAARGLHQLGPSQKLVDGEIVDKTEDELVAEGFITLEAIKTQLTEAYSKAAFQLRAQLIPDYKLQNAALGVYDDKQVAEIRATVAAFRAEFYRLKELIEKATSASALKAIEPKFPTAVVQA